MKVTQLNLAMYEKITSALIEEALAYAKAVGTRPRFKARDVEDVDVTDGGVEVNGSVITPHGGCENFCVVVPLKFIFSPVSWESERLRKQELDRIESENRKFRLTKEKEERIRHSELKELQRLVGKYGYTVGDM